MNRHGSLYPRGHAQKEACVALTAERYHVGSCIAVGCIQARDSALIRRDDNRFFLRMAANKGVPGS